MRMMRLLRQWAVNVADTANLPPADAMRLLGEAVTAGDVAIGLCDADVFYVYKHIAAVAGHHVPTSACHGA